MKKRLILAACKDTHRTNWMRATGDERSVEVCGMGGDDTLSLVLSDGSDVKFYQLGDGTSEFPAGSWRCYQISKVAGKLISATTVEIHMRQE